MKNISDFIRDVTENPDFAAEIGQQLAKIPVGDWESVARTAIAMGYNLTPKELIQHTPAGFFKGFGNHINQGWDIIADPSTVLAATTEITPNCWPSSAPEIINPSNW